MCPTGEAIKSIGPRLNIAFQKGKQSSATAKTWPGHAAGIAFLPSRRHPLLRGTNPRKRPSTFRISPKAYSRRNAVPTTTPDADFFIPANPADLLSSLSPFGPVSPPLSPSGNVSTVPERPFGAGSFGGAPGPFLGGGVYYPPTTASSGRAFSPASGAIIAGAGIATPEPSTVPLLLLAVLLGSPALLHARQNRADPNVRNN